MYFNIDKNNFCMYNNMYKNMYFNMYKNERKNKMAKVIAIANQKGGVAKTTTSHALAAGLVKKGFRVLAIDLDPQGNLSDATGADNYNELTIYEVLKGTTKAEDVIQTKNGLDIIAANILLAGAEQEIVQAGKEHRLKEKLEKITPNYDFIIIDCPPSLGVLTANAFTFASDIIIPSNAGIFAASGIGQLHGLISSIKKYCNPSVKIRGILMTRYNPRANISMEMKDLTEKLASMLEAPVYETYIRNSVVVEEAQANHEDIYSWASGSTVAKDYEKFVEEFLKGEN